LSIVVRFLFWLASWFARGHPVNTFKVSSESPRLLIDIATVLGNAGFDLVKLSYAPGPPVVFTAEFDAGEDGARLTALTEKLNSAAAEMDAAVTDASKA
jgi:hypothetical protein